MNNYLAGINVLPLHPLAPHTTWGIGGAAELYAEIHTVEQLVQVVKTAQKQNQNIFILGAGSNILIDDNGVPGWTIHLTGDLEKITFNTNLVEAGAGTFLPHLVRQCAQQGLGGIEPLVGVPGSLGGALRMNAGTRQLQIGQITTHLTALDLRNLTLKTLYPQDAQWSYRQSKLDDYIVVSACLKLVAKSKADVLSTVQDFLTQRLKSQPVGSKNCGSVFKNPDGHFAAQLIEQAGLKNYAIGAAQVSEKHANFIINTGNASASDVKKLIAHIQKTVYSFCGIMLQREVKYIP